jgi:hypothetical protein
VNAGGESPGFFAGEIFTTSQVTPAATATITAM